MGDGPLTTSTNQELRNRKPSASPSPEDDDFLTTSPTEDELSHHRKSTAGDPSPNTFDISTFRSLIATNKSATDIILSPCSSPDTPLFYIKNGSWKRNTASVTFHHSNKEGAVLGTLKLGWGRDNTFGLGDPTKIESDGIGGGEWFNLKRTSEWAHATYEFEWRGKTFVWQRTKRRVFSDQPNMELFVKGQEGTLAVYKGNQGLMWKSRGQFWLSPLLKAESGVAFEGSTAGIWSELEVLALLSALGIIESSRRRARARRNGGGAGGSGGG